MRLECFRRVILIGNDRFLDCEKWRQEFNGGVDNLVRNFDYTERPKVFEYYPQYYHKTDKVCPAHSLCILIAA